MKTTTKFLVILIFSIILGINYSAKSQEIISSSGIYSESANNSISWINSGEIATTNLRNECSSKQRFNQITISVISEWEIKDLDVEIIALPNQIAGNILLKFPKGNNDNFKLQLLDTQGIILKKQDILGSEAEISFGELPSATYQIKVIDKKREIKLFTIIKN